MIRIFLRTLGAGLLLVLIFIWLLPSVFRMNNEQATFFKDSDILPFSR